MNFMTAIKNIGVASKAQLIMRCGVSVMRTVLPIKVAKKLHLNLNKHSTKLMNPVKNTTMLTKLKLLWVTSLMAAVEIN